MRHSGPEWCSYTVIYVRMRNIETPVNTEVFQLPGNLLNCCPEKHSQKLTSLSFASERHVEPKNPMGNSLTKIKIIHLGDMLCYANQNACNSFHTPPSGGSSIQQDQMIQHLQLLSCPREFSLIHLLLHLESVFQEHYVKCTGNEANSPGRIIACILVTELLCSGA